ncbi:MAG: AMP-binding protein, partial [Syntrophales bacterium]
MEKIKEEILSELARLTLPQVLIKQAERFGKRIALREKAYGIWQTYTWEDYLGYVRATCMGLLSLDLKRGDNIGIVTNNHPEWLFSELGAQAAGAITVNLFTSAVSEELASSLNRIQAAFVFVQDQEQADKLL